MSSGEETRSMISSVEEYDGVMLSPVERLLMATDGTITHMLEALTRGPVDVDILSRQTDAGSLDRRVVLRRDSDGSPLVWAASDVNLYALPESMEEALVQGDIGIGDLLRDEYKETRREIVGMDATWPDSAAFPSFIDGHSALYLEREYKVYSNGNRLMTIREWMPKGLF